MFVPFNALPSHSVVWIFQSDKKITAEERNIISEALTAFTNQWTVHGTPLEASFDVRFDYFIVIGANAQASGCSIDSLVRTVKAIGETTGVDFFNRTNVAFTNNGDVTLIATSDLKLAYQRNLWNESTLMFNNVAATKDALDTDWIVPAQNTWLKRYLPRETVNE